MIHHPKIHRESIEGIIDSDKDIPRMKQELIRLITDSMSDDGYVPVLDLLPAFSTEYVKGHYEFLLSIYFVKIGKEAYKWSGLSDNKLISRYTLPAM